MALRDPTDPCPLNHVISIPGFHPLDPAALPVGRQRVSKLDPDPDLLWPGRHRLVVSAVVRRSLLPAATLLAS
eukprot:3834197-Rhodomonas_salina.1